MSKTIRVVLAVAAGYVTMALLVAAGTAVFSALFAVSAAAAVPPPKFVVATLIFSAFSAGIGGYVCGRLAPAERVAISVGLLMIVVLVIGGILARAAATPSQPLWYQAIVTMLGASGIMMGAAVERSRHATAMKIKRGR